MCNCLSQQNTPIGSCLTCFWTGCLLEYCIFWLALAFHSAPGWSPIKQCIWYWAPSRPYRAMSLCPAPWLSHHIELCMKGHQNASGWQIGMLYWQNPVQGTSKWNFYQTIRKSMVVRNKSMTYWPLEQKGPKSYVKVPGVTFMKCLSLF